MLPGTGVRRGRPLSAGPAECLQESLGILEADDAQTVDFLAGAVEEDDAGWAEEVEALEQCLVVIVVGGDIDL